MLARPGQNATFNVLQQVIQSMENQDNLFLLISEQNAGIILCKLEFEIMLEIFQASALAVHVTGNGGKLLIQYPSRPRLSSPSNPLLIESLSTYLATMGCAEMPEAVPTTRKAQSEQKESHEVPDICYMSDLLGGITRALTPDVNATASSTTSLLEWKIHGRYGYKAFTTHVLVLTSEEIHAAEGFALARRRGYLSAVYNRRRLSPPTQIPTGSAGSELWLAVLDVEHWITKHLHNWQMTTRMGMRLEVLGQMIASFDSIAISMDNPEQFSRVFLIILELCVALDETAVEAIPLLRKYSPNFSIFSFEPLLLPTLCQMRRLWAVETHLSHRHADANPTW
ncbi:hypothetical protein JB92DRAFT_2838311 [Gautieria morchelliformis]|nr:hypothetical protein JB92DRAFT_2838311 [Gautieria morchelliformis]